MGQNADNDFRYWGKGYMVYYGIRQNKGPVFCAKWGLLLRVGVLRQILSHLSHQKGSSV